LANVPDVVAGGHPRPSGHPFAIHSVAARVGFPTECIIRPAVAVPLLAACREVDVPFVHSSVAYSWAACSPHRPVYRPTSRSALPISAINNYQGDGMNRVRGGRRGRNSFRRNSHPKGGGMNCPAATDWQEV